MYSYVKYLVFFSSALIVLYIGWNTFSYYSSLSIPSVTVAGMSPEGSYAGDLSFTIKGHDDYKVARMSVTLDEKPLVQDAKIGKKTFTYPLSLDTKTLSHGQHLLKIELTKGAYNAKKMVHELTFFVDNLPLQAAFTKNDVDAKVFQGRTLHVQFQANKALKEAIAKTLSRTYPCFQESPRTFIYECFIPIDCEEVPNEYRIIIDAADGVGNTRTLEGKFQVVAFPFKRQSLHIEPEKMKDENEKWLPEKQLEAEIEELTQKSPHQKLWHGTFVTPLEIKDPKQITTAFGVTRATQERGLRQHKALDVYSTPKGVVWAPQDGIVVLKNRYAHSGNTLIIDHGWGILSLFFHLDTFTDIDVGEKIKKGNPLGTIGKTGYATGYHLHWEMRVNNVAIDPMEWTKPGF